MDETVFKLIPVDEDVNIKIEIYDPGYKELELKTENSQNELFENVTSIMFVYDMTDQGSYQCAKDLIIFILELEIKENRRFLKNLVGCKCDDENCIINSEEAQQFVK